MGTVKKLYQDQLVGGSGSAGQEVYPVTSTLGVYDTDNNQLQGVLDKVTTNLGLFTCGTAVATAAKTVSASKFVLMEGGSVKIKFTHANSAASPTLAIGTTAAKPIIYNGAEASASNSWEAEEVVEFYYDGTNWVGRTTTPVTKEQLNQLGQEMIGIENDEHTLVFSDKNGAIPLMVSGGHIKTRLFDSEKASRVNDSENLDFAISDESGWYVLGIKNGHIKTRNFDSSLIKAELEDVEEKIRQLESPQGLLYTKFFNTTTSITEYNNIDGSNNKLTADGLQVSSAGNRITLDRYYSLSDRMVEYLCKFNSSSVAVFRTDQTPPYITIDMVNKKFSILNGNVISEVNLEQGIETHLFKVQIIKQYQKQTARLIDVTAGKTYEVSKTQDGEGGAGAGSLNPNPTIIGMQSDKYQFYAGAGTFLIKNIKIVCLVNNVKLLLYGDSITEPEAYYPSENFNSAWTQLVMSQVNGTAVSSGRSGTDIDALFARIVNELPFINTKYVMVTIGTNGGNTIAKLRQLVEYILSCGAIPILNNIPCNDNNGTSNTAENNAMIEQVRNEYGIKGCLFNIATSVGGDGVTLDYSTMYHEDYPNVGTWYHHPNPKGAELMFERTFVDVPEIYE